MLSSAYCFFICRKPSATSDSLITGVRGKEIACGVKGEAKTLPRKQTKGALSSFRRAQLEASKPAPQVVNNP
jgi:hypothetical protein